MPDYNNGKIYQIWDEDYQECYLGSTVQELSMRMCEHRKNYRDYLKKSGVCRSVFKLFDKYDMMKCRIELLGALPL